MVAPFGGVVYAHTHDIRVVGDIPRLGHGLAQQAPYARGLSRAAAARPASRSCQRAPSLITCALKSAVKCVFGRTFQGILVACTPSLGQSALGSAQCTMVSYCQMLRCHKVLSRVSQVPHLLWHTGHSTAWPFLWATLTWSSSCAPSRSLNQTSQSSHSSLSPLGPLKEPCQHACLKHPYRTLGTQPPVGENPTV